MSSPFFLEQLTAKRLASTTHEMKAKPNDICFMIRWFDLFEILIALLKLAEYVGTINASQVTGRNGFLRILMKEEFIFHNASNPYTLLEQVHVGTAHPHIKSNN